MYFSYSGRIASSLALASLLGFASADNSLLSVLPGDECVPLVTGTDLITLGKICTVVDEDNVVVTFNMTGVGEDCCIKESHICNMPPMIANIEEDGCAQTKVVPFGVADVFGFMCSEPCETFQFNGHATVICDTPLRGDFDYAEEPGDPLPDGVGQGNYGEEEFCYGAMYDVGLECGPCTDLCPAFDCSAEATPCGDTEAANDIDCFCSRSIENIAPHPELEDFCWQDIGCYVPLFYLTTKPGVACETSDVCVPGTKCVPNTCCGQALCLPACNPEGGDKEYTVGAVVIPEEDMVCDPKNCTKASGKGTVFEYA